MDGSQTVEASRLLDRDRCSLGPRELMESFGNFNKSISYLPKLKKYSLYEAITIDNRENYYLVSSSPITKEAEDDMELLSDMVTGECYLHHWEPGIYICAQCKNALYSSKGMS